MVKFAIGFFVGVGVAIATIAALALWFSDELVIVVDEED